MQELQVKAMTTYQSTIQLRVASKDLAYGFLQDIQTASLDSDKGFPCPAMPPSIWTKDRRADLHIQQSPKQGAPVMLDQWCRRTMEDWAWSRKLGTRHGPITFLCWRPVPSWDLGRRMAESQDRPKAFPDTGNVNAILDTISNAGLQVNFELNPLHRRPVLSKGKKTTRNLWVGRPNPKWSTCAPGLAFQLQGDETCKTQRPG